MWPPTEICPRQANVMNRFISSTEPIDVVSGFLDAKGEAQGRPVGVIVDKAGGLLVADDVGNVVWQVSAAK